MLRQRTSLTTVPLRDEYLAKRDVRGAETLREQVHQMIEVFILAGQRQQLSVAFGVQSIFRATQLGRDLAPLTSCCTASPAGRLDASSTTLHQARAAARSGELDLLQRRALRCRQHSIEDLASRLHEHVALIHGKRSKRIGRADETGHRSPMLAHLVESALGSELTEICIDEVIVDGHGIRRDTADTDDIFAFFKHAERAERVHWTPAKICQLGI